MSGGASLAIEADRLTKHRGDKVAVRNLSLRIPEGSIYGLVGPNGSGKTTTLSMLTGLLHPDSGRSTVFGEDALRMSVECRQRIGYLSEAPFPYDLIFTDCLEFLSRFFSVWDWAWCQHLIDGLDVQAHKRLSEMSLGERRVAELLLAVAHKPQLLILDDPAVGLDAVVRREILWTLLEAAREEGATVVFSSHVLQDVERIVDHVGILSRARLRVSGSLDEIQASTRRLVFSADSAPDSVVGEVTRERVGGDELIVTSEFSDDLVARFPAVRIETMNLEDIFVALTQRRKVARA